MPLPSLDPDSLTILVFGPGYGELILVHVPPGQWLVIDGCAVGKIEYVEHALTYYGVLPSIILLTHPHDDHSRGIKQLVERCTQGKAPSEWPRIGMVLPPGPTSPALPDDFNAASTKAAIAIIEQRWNDSPACRWDVNVGDVEPLGEATLRVVSPKPTTRRKQLDRWSRGEPFDKNIISTAILLEWDGRRIIFGSDLTRNGWNYCLTNDSSLPDHDLLKVSHHGSNNALHDELLDPGTRSPEPVRIIAPFNTKKLPKFSPGDGVRRIAQWPSSIYVTSLPIPHARQSGDLETRNLTELETWSADWSQLQFPRNTSGFPDCYVALSFSRGNVRPRIERGAGSVEVIP